jgi:hypothetical protein
VRDMGTPGSPPTRVSTVPDRRARPTRRPPTCQWALSDLTCGPKDMKTAWSASQYSPDSLRQFG